MVDGGADPPPPIKSTLIVGCGYVGSAVAKELRERGGNEWTMMNDYVCVAAGIHVTACTTRGERKDALIADGIADEVCVIPPCKTTEVSNQSNRNDDSPPSI